MDHIKQVANRLRGLRDALDLTVEQMAEQCDVTPVLLATYESGTSDIPVSFLHKLASTYGIELTALMFGEEPTMNSYYITRAGKGIKVERTKAYSYQDLASGFQHRIMAPFLVTIEPCSAEHPLTLNTHQGQEFNYVLEGELEISTGGKASILHPGDSIMFDARRPHGLRALGDKPAKIIAIIS
ncbi:MAG: XRE family transcriptional regulator [Muribaculum sp.]|nr:XRE family transcriptional regulator [Muribaculum sp.]